MTPLALLLLSVVLLGETVSHLCMKGASLRAAHATGPRYLLALARDPLLWFGILAWVVLFFSWMGFLSLVPLGEGVMLGSVTIVGVMIGGRLCFGERITPARATAIAFIALGVALVGWGHG
jgi:drug/metabolite transporter (DMT)-like permease